MSKFIKRLGKLKNNLRNAIVIGQGFGRLPEIASIFKTVFVFSNTPTVRSKNIVFRTNYIDLSQLTEIDMILIDLDHITQLATFTSIWLRDNSLILIEGNEPIGREFSQSLYNTNYRCLTQLGHFHLWKVQ